MALEIRKLADGEQGAFAASASVPFFETGDVDSPAHWAAHLEPERSWVVVDKGRFVGNSCIFSRDMTVPGAARSEAAPAIPIAAVSGVGVHPTHRRQGLLRRMMKAMLDDASDRGEAVAALIASESRIYGRFGFGQATSASEWTADTREVAFSRPVPAGDFALVDSGEAAKVIPDLFDRFRRQRAGQVNRNPAAWADVWNDVESRRSGGGPNFYLVGDDGFATYRIHPHQDEHWEQHTAVVRDLYGATPEVEAALWQFVFDLDLIRTARGTHQPVDDALRWRLTDPRQLRVTAVGDVLWVCVLDVAAALEARRYLVAGRLVLDVRPLPGDDADGAATGRWVLEGGPEGATCRKARTGEAADLTLGRADLGALYLGGVTATVLAAAGRVSEERPGALGEGDRLLSGRAAPFSATTF